jgi:hypothetical protein
MLEVRLSRGRLRRLKAKQTRGALLKSVSLSETTGLGGDEPRGRERPCNVGKEPIFPVIES